MAMKNIIPTYCRIFWGFMFTMFFILGWASFYNTKICIDNVRVVIEGDKTEIMSLTTYVALGFVVYCILLLSFPLIYLVHQLSRLIVNGAKLLLGEKLVNAGCNFLAITVFPILCIFMEDICEDEASLWASIGIMGSIFCLFICRANPADYGLKYPFFAIWLGVLFNLKHTLGKWVVFTMIVVSILFSIKVEVQIDSEVDPSSQNEGMQD